MILTRKTVIKLPVIEKKQETKIFPLRKKLSHALDTKGTQYYVYAHNTKTDFKSYLTEIDPITGKLALMSIYSSRGVKFATATEAREAALKWIGPVDLRKHSLKIEIYGEFEHYCVQHPSKKDTYQKEVALSWYKEYRTHQNYNNEICYFIEGGSNYIDISLYYYDCDRGTIYPLKCNGINDNAGKITDYIFRYSNQGEILGVVLIDEKGKRTLSNTRGWYLDNTRGWHLDRNDSSRKTDLRNQSLNSEFFHPDTMKIIKEAGFDTVMWGSSWGFNESPSRVNTFGNLMRYGVIRRNSYYHRDNTQRSAEINAFCKDLPFDEEHCVVPFKNGYIARFGKIIQAWQSVPYSYSRHNCQDEECNYDLENVDPVEICSVTANPTTYTNKEGKTIVVSKLVEEKFVESARIWISNTFSIRSICVSKCGGTRWEPTRIDLCDNRWSDGSNFSPSNPIYTELDIDLEKFNKTVYEKLFKSHPRLKYLIGYTDRHPTLYKGDDIKFLRALFDYQKVIETFISLGMDDMFWCSSSSRRGKDAECFNFNNFIDDMKLKEIPHKASSDFYQILGLNKAQFKLIFKDPDLSYNEIMNVLYRISWEQLIPNFPTDGWRAEDHRQRAAYPLIPVQYIELIIKTIKDQTTNRMSSRYNTYDIANKINNFVDYGFDLKAIYKYLCIKRVDAQLYYDYLRMRGELEHNSTTSHFDPHLWDKKLDDADDVHFTHDRMVFVYNQWSAECARYRCLSGAEKEKKRQELYDERYKTLKSFNYHEKEDSRSIVVPEKLMEIVVEGQVLHHCVGSFVESVSEGHDTIVFLRNKAMPDVPYATVSLLYDTVAKEWYIDQAHTAYNGDITEEDVSFLKCWGLKHKVRQSSIRKQYRARCHH